MPRSVLIVEDEEILLRNLMSTLARAGAEASGATSVAEARRLLSARRFSLICIDIRLGDGDGIELIGTVRATMPDLPVIVMTGQDCVDNRLRAESIDASAFLAKPFALSRFRELVATLLQETADTVGPTQRAPSVLMYSHDTIGLGHMRRNSAIAAEIVTTMPQASVLMLVGCPTGVLFDLPPGVDFIKLPSLTKVSRNVWRPGSLRISSGDTRAIRAGLIDRAVETFKPDLFLVDHEPTGVWDELVPALERLRNDPNKPRAVLGLRDILDEPDRTRADWQRRGIGEHVRRLYDDILVYGQQNVFPSDKAYGLSELAPGNVRYCGYVVSSSHSRVKTARAIRTREHTPRIIVAGGGGRDAFPMMDASLRALADLPRRCRDGAVLISGPLMDEELRDILKARAKSAGIKFLKFTRDLPALLRDADLFVTMGGYNSLTEAMMTGCPTLVIPRVGPSSEQRMRSEILAGRGFVETLPQEYATPDALSARFRRVRAGAPRRYTTLPFDGAINAAEIITDILSKCHPESVVVERRKVLHA